MIIFYFNLRQWIYKIILCIYASDCTISELKIILSIAYLEHDDYRTVHVSRYEIMFRVSHVMRFRNEIQRTIINTDLGEASSFA